MRYLLENYIIEENEPMLAIELIDQLVSLARAHADTMIVQDGFQLRLDDSPNLNMPFVLPRDGFIVESLRGIPPDMTSYMDALQLKGEIRVLLPSSSRQNPMQIWTGHMSSRTSIDPQIHGTPQCLPSPSMQRHASLSSKRTNGSTNRSLFPSGERGIDVIGLNSSQQPSIMQITLKRPPGKGIGLSIVEIVGQRIQSGIYIKKVIEGSAAFQV
jgi:hypothetical protein